MKLDTKAIRYLTSEDWRVLTAVEQGSKNHEVVPTPLITQIAGLRGGSGVHRSISALAKVGLIGKVKNARYDGYRLTYGGLDYLALNAHRKTSTVFSLGNQIGVGKESDIYVVASATGTTMVLKIHRLGRISFRTVKANRDYLRNRTSGSWMYLSRLAAMKEHAFMKVLRREGFPVPEPIAQSRHTIIMEFINSFPLRQIESVPDPAGLYAELMDLIVRLARVGLIHGDFNEFNILIKEEPGEGTSDAAATSQSDEQAGSLDAQAQAPPRNVKLTPIIIDFPQMLSITHQNATFYFDRDVACIKRFFARRFNFEADEPGPFFADAIKDSSKTRLDVEVEATGFSRKMAKDLEKYIETVGTEAEQDANGVGADSHDVGDADDEADADYDYDLGGEPSNESTQDDQIGDHQVHDVTTNVAHDFGHLDLHSHSAFLPLDLPKDPDIVVAEARGKKKAAGWAI